MSNGANKVLAQATDALKGLSTKAVAVWQRDIEQGVLRPVVRSVTETTHAIRRAGPEVERAGAGLWMTEGRWAGIDDATRATQSLSGDGGRPHYLGPVLPEDRPITADERRLAGESIDKLKELFGPRANPGSLASRVDPDEVVAAARARAARNARWWHALTDDQRAAMVRVRPHLIGNTDGVPYAVRDRANRLSITRDLEWYLYRRQSGDRRDSRLSDEENAHLSNIVSTRDHLETIEDRARALGASNVQLMAYNPRAYAGNGRVAVSIGNADDAEIVTRQVGGFGTTLRSLEYRSDLITNEWEMTTRYAGHNRIASIVDIGYHHPTALVPLEPAKPIFAEVGGYVISRDVTSFNATREAWAHLDDSVAPPQLRNLVGHSYGSTAVCYAGAEARLAGEIDQISLSGSPGAGPLNNAADFGIGRENVYVFSSCRDPISALGAETPAGQGRFLGTGLGIDPANAHFQAVRVAAEPPVTKEFAGKMRVHQGYNAFADPQTREPTEALHNMALVNSGRAGEVMRVEHRPAVETPALRHRIGTPLVDPEQARIAGNA